MPSFKPGVNWERIRQRYEAGESANAIAKTVEVSKQAILKHVKAKGWKQSQLGVNNLKRQAADNRALATMATQGRAPIAFQHWWGKDTPESRAKILDALDKGATYELAAKAAGLSRMTLHDWRRKDPDFAEACEAAKANHVVEHVGVIDDAGRETRDWKASAHMLAKNPLTKAEWGEAKGGGPSITVNLSVDRGHPDKPLIIDGQTIPQTPLESQE